MSGWVIEGNWRLNLKIIGLISERLISLISLLQYSHVLHRLLFYIEESDEGKFNSDMEFITQFMNNTPKTSQTKSTKSTAHYLQCNTTQHNTTRQSSPLNFYNYIACLVSSYDYRIIVRAH